MTLEFAANHEGAMLAVFAPPGVATRIAIPGGEPADDLHVTLFYFYDNADLTDADRKLILELAGKLAAEYPGLDVFLHGTTVFEENEERPLVAVVNSPTLETFRRRLAVALDLAGIRYSKEHDFKPHLTLKYLNGDTRPDVQVEEYFTAKKVEARFADTRYPVFFGNHFVRQAPRPGHFAAPKAGQRQRIGAGTWEEKTNRQQRKLVKVFDQWAAGLKGELAKKARNGATLPDLQVFLDDQIPKLRDRLLEINAAGVRSAAKTAAGSRYDSAAVQGKVDQLTREGEALIRENLVPRVHEKMTLALATAVPGLVIGGLAVEQQRAVALAIKNASAATRAAPAQYAGGYWVAIFEVQRTLGEERESERQSQGLDIEAVRWVLDPRAEHCKPSAGFYGCPELAGEYPGGWRTLPTVPAGQVTCRGNCRCHLEVKREGQWQRGVFED